MVTVIHRMVLTETMGGAWLRHNVEEVGLLEYIIPAYLRRRKGRLMSASVQMLWTPARMGGASH